MKRELLNLGLKMNVDECEHGDSYEFLNFI
jgi:hypothetical protein